MREYSGMTTIGLVLSAGGFSGAAHHSGVLDALSSVTGWDSRTSDVVVGTSAGSLIAVSLRAGISPHDLACYYTDDTMTPEGQEIIDRVTTSLKVPEPGFSGNSKIPSKPSLVQKKFSWVDGLGLWSLSPE